MSSLELGLMTKRAKLRLVLATLTGDTQARRGAALEGWACPMFMAIIYHMEDLSLIV